MAFCLVPKYLSITTECAKYGFHEFLVIDFSQYVYKSISFFFFFFDSISSSLFTSIHACWAAERGGYSKQWRTEIKFETKLFGTVTGIKEENIWFKPRINSTKGCRCSRWVNSIHTSSLIFARSVSDIYIYIYIYIWKFYGGYNIFLYIKRPNWIIYIYI